MAACFATAVSTSVTPVEDATRTRTVLYARRLPVDPRRGGVGAGTLSLTGGGDGGGGDGGGLANALQSLGRVA